MDGDKSPEDVVGTVSSEELEIDSSFAKFKPKSVETPLPKAVFDPLRMNEYEKVKKGKVMELIDPQTSEVVGRRRGGMVITGEYDSKREDYIEEPGLGQTALKDPKTGEVVAWIMEMKGGAGVIPDPEAADLAGSETTRAWVEKVLRSFERNEDRKITSQVEDSLTATISSKIPVGILNLGGALYTHTAPDGRPETLNQELIRLVEARVAYHNSSLSARLGLANLGEEYGGITLNEHMEIFNTRGVKEAIAELERNDGEFYRMRGAAAIDAERNRIRNLLRTRGIGNPALNANEEDAATLALELAERTMHIHGESGYYTGIWDIHGNNIRFTGPDMLERYARYFEENWNQIAFFRDPSSGMPLVDTRGGLPGVAITPETLPEYIDYVSKTPAVGGPAAAALLASLTGGASWNQLSGEGALHERGTYHTPVFLENPLTPNRGTAAFLRRYAYTWVSSGVRFSRNPNDISARTSMVEAIDHYGDDWAKWFIWTARASAAHKGRSVFTEKGLESILNMPLIDPNVLFHDDSLQTISKVMENYKKAQAAYEGLPQIEKQTAMTHLLKGILRYADRRNLNQARREGFNWIGLTQKNMDDIIYWAMREDVISVEQSRQLRREVKVSTAIAAAQAAAPHLGEGLKGFWKIIWSGITKT